MSLKFKDLNIDNGMVQVLSFYWTYAQGRRQGLNVYLPRIINTL